MKDSYDLTVEIIINFAIKNGLNYHAHTERVHMVYGDRGDTFIGIEFKKNIWYWWRAHNLLDRKAKQIIFFMYRFNAANGAIQKTVRKGWVVEKQILNFEI